MSRVHLIADFDLMSTVYSDQARDNVLLKDKKSYAFERHNLFYSRGLTLYPLLNSYRILERSSSKWDWPKVAIFKIIIGLVIDFQICEVAPHILFGKWLFFPLP